jgi:transcriptional regulator with XRE-family HTH domain
MTTPTRLRTERLRRGWTLLFVARATGISPSDLSQIEWRRRYAFAGWRRRLALAYGMSEEALFGDLPHDIEGSATATLPALARAKGR